MKAHGASRVVLCTIKSPKLQSGEPKEDYRLLALTVMSADNNRDHNNIANAMRRN